MLRLVGAILVIGGAAAIGLSASRKLKNRVSMLSALINALEIMQSEIYFKLTALPEIILLLSETAEYPVCSLFRDCLTNLRSSGNSSFAACFTKAVKENAIELRASEVQVLLELSHVLGRYDVEGQSGAISYAIRRFEAYLREAQEEYKGQGKVCKALGLVCGIVCVIILI